MKTSKKIVALIPVFVAIASCKTTIEEPKSSSGDADFTRYVAIGESFTAGYTDDALSYEGQLNSYPSILSSAFAKAGVTGTFTQPLVNQGAGIGINGNAKLILSTAVYSCGTAESYFLPKPYAPTGDGTNLTHFIGVNGPYSNLGVPGMRSFNLNDEYYSNSDPQLGNPYFARFAKNPGTSTVLSDAAMQTPTFFTLWIGMDDILPYAIGGGVNDNDSLASASYPSTFRSNVAQIINTLKASTANGVIASVPDVTDFPFFSTIPYNGLVLTASQASTFNHIFATIDPSIVFYEGNNAFIISDASRPSRMRQIKEGEYILMNVPLDSIRCASYGSYDVVDSMPKPLSDKFVLDGAELSLIRSRIYSFNASLQSLATTNDMAYVDLSDFFKQIYYGIKFNGVSYTTEYLHGGAFSLDGIHPTAKGYALIANEFIKAINEKYGATIHLVDANAYPGIKFP
jgi:hypothetical protein